MEHRLTHVDEDGQARMVDVSAKSVVVRSARAGGFIRLADTTLALIRRNGIKKGDVLTVAKIAGIMGGKRSADLIPLCHNIEIDHIDVTLELRDDGVRITSTARCVGKTGIEMEALTAVSVAALTVYDMCKAVDKNMRIEDIHLVEKTKDEYRS